MTFNPSHQSSLNIQTLKMSFITGTAFSTEEIERFRKIFRTMATYEESISSKDIIPFVQAINYIKPMDTYQGYIDYADKVLGGRFELTQLVKYMQACHDSRLLMNEYLINFDTNNDGYVSKEEFAFGMATIRRHDPSTKEISYENFIKEADADKNGRISVAECKDWLIKNLG